MGVPLTRVWLFHLGNSERFDRLVRAVTPARALAYARAQRYVAGVDLDDALRVTRRLLGFRFAASIDYLGWYVDRPPDIEEVTAEYLRLCSALWDLRADVHVSLDLTHFGLRSSVERCCHQVRRIAECLPPGARIQLGGESARDANQVLVATLALAELGVPVMATLQANLRRAARDADLLVDRHVAIRLCKGAYVESKSDAYPWGPATDANYTALAHRLAAGGVPLALATHDPALLTSLLPAIPGAGVEVLLGVRETETRALAGGRPLRVYVPYGENWFRYYLHRIAEARGA